MSAQAMQRPASEKQLACIKSLSAEMGGQVPEVEKGMSNFEASQLISELIGKSIKNGLANGGKHVINEPRLGMAMKECFRLHTRLGRDIWRERKEWYIRSVIDTYNIFTEIEEKLQNCPNAHDGERSEQI